MIVNPSDLSAGFDQAMRDRLAALGYDVTVVASGDVGGAFTIDDADNHDLLLVSESIGSSSADPLIGTTTPTMHNESYGWDNWSLTTGENMHWASGASVDIVNDAHPIATMAGVQVGPMAFFSSSASWTTDSVSALAPGAELIAQVNDAGTDCAIIFAVEEGAELANGSGAPTRIAGFSVPGNNAYEAADMTDEAWALFDATVRWLTRSVLPTVAKAPIPADASTDVPRNVVLGWGPGESADTHDVYLGTVFNDVNDASRTDPRGVLVSQGQDANSYDPGPLEYGTTYYWRVDEVNAPPDSTIFKGPVWSLETEPYAYPAENVVATSNGVSETDPQKTVDGSGLNEVDQHSSQALDMWLATPVEGEALWIQYEFEKILKLHEMLVWNYNVAFEAVLGFGLKDVTIEYSVDGEGWTVLGDAELAQATARSDYMANTVVDFGGVATRHVRLTVNSGHGMMGKYGLSEVRFMYIPAQAREPQPADGATDVAADTALSWRAGREAVVHDVLLGTDPEALTAVGSVTEATYMPADLEFGVTYYWQINEVNEADDVTVWEGDLWTFATQEFAAIDDMESYDDDANRIFDTWLDGFVNGTGSTVGYFEAPFAERSTVNSGGQSMPMEYANDAAPFYSEAEYDLGGMDLDTNGAHTLHLFVAGQAPAFAEAADGTILMNAVGADIWNTADEFRYAYKTLSGDGALVARVDSLADSDVWAKGGVMIRETIDAGSAFAAVYMTGNNGVRFQGRLEGDASAVSDSSVATDEQIALREPVWVKIERVGNAFNGYYSTDGENWTAMAWNPQTIPMANDVTIGLALTSHNASVTTGAAFAGVAEEGGVSGNWQIAEIGVAQPTTGNDIAPLYIALEDTSGNVAVVTHPNPAAVGVAAWQEWLIPYSDLGGINLNRVATMYIGLGDRDNPTAGGTGLIFIDDIGYGRPTAAQ
jgi:hypothetical protein